VLCFLMVIFAAVLALLYPITIAKKMIERGDPFKILFVFSVAMVAMVVCCGIWIHCLRAQAVILKAENAVLTTLVKAQK